MSMKESVLFNIADRPTPQIGRGGGGAYIDE